MFEFGTVVEIQGDMAVVEFCRHSSCASCNACMTFSEKAMRIAVPNKLNANIGDKVSVKINASSFFEAAFLAYILPLVALIAGLMGSYVFFDSDFVAMLIGLFCALLVYIALKLLEPKFKKSLRYSPAMVEIVN